VYVKVQGVRELYAVLSKVTDVTLLEPLCHQPYGQTEFVIRDPMGTPLFWRNAISIPLELR
jgi:hypothetical protein